jgi:membrane-bound ClpP family serine protease
MRGIDGVGNLVLVIMAAASLVTVIAAFGANMIVNGYFYSYGLRFNYKWAIPYWNLIGLVFAMAWLNIISALAFEVYRIRITRKEKAKSPD